MYFCLYFDIFICRFKNCWTVFALSVYSEAAIFVLVGQLLSSICQAGQFSGQFCNSQLSQCGDATCVHSINILQLHSVQLSACCPTLSGRQSQLMGIPCHQKASINAEPTQDASSGLTKGIIACAYYCLASLLQILGTSVAAVCILRDQKNGVCRFAGTSMTCLQGEI